jgi:hypothetical protein
MKINLVAMTIHFIIVLIFINTMINKLSLEHEAISANCYQEAK